MEPSPWAGASGRQGSGGMTAVAGWWWRCIYRAEVRLTVADVGKRIVLRWRRPASGGRDEVADVLGMLEAADGASFTVRKASGELVVIPIERALAGKVVPPAPRR